MIKMKMILSNKYDTFQGNIDCVVHTVGIRNNVKHHSAEAEKEVCKFNLV